MYNNDMNYVEFIKIFALVPLIIFSIALGLAIDTFIGKIINPNSWDFLGYFYSFMIAVVGLVAWIIFKLLNRQAIKTSFNSKNTIILSAILGIGLSILIFLPL